MPLAAVLGVTVSGALIVARQVTAPPQQYPRRLAVGCSRSVEIAATVKGSRPLPKVYTDLTAAAEGPRVWYSMGLEPTIALVRPRQQPLDNTLPRALVSGTSSGVAVNNTCDKRRVLHAQPLMTSCYQLLQCPPNWHRVSSCRPD